MKQPAPRAGSQVLTASVTLVVAVVLAYAALETLTLSQPLRVAIALLPWVAFAWFIAAEVRLVRGLDELQQRIQLQALAVAYPTSILLVFGLGLLERAGVVVSGFRDLRDVWPLTIMAYFIGLALARRRYQ